MKRPFPIAVLLASTMLAADLPVREVILYKNGVAYYQRSGQLGAGETAKLDFKSTEMNDLLKSLTVSDGSGGKVTAVRYDSAEPVDRRLAEFPIQIGANQPLTAFLDRMKGAKLTLRYGNDTIVGTIVAARVASGGTEKGEREVLTLLLDSGDIRTFDLGSGVGGLQFTDPAVQGQLKAYLAVLSQSRSTDRRSVYVDSTSSAARRISASYMLPAPVWKSSYRLIMAADTTLEGWAIVDNTTADDWNDVRLSLVSGRPVSFISRLYEPRYKQRPFGDLAEDEIVGPRVYAGAVTSGRTAQMAANAMEPAAPVAKAMRAEMARTDEARDAASFVAPSAAAVNMAGREVGELFEYGFSNPVTVKRGQSAMLPFIQEKIAARKLLIYSDESTANPMNAAEITNSTSKTLDGGPITVYDTGAYAGEALMETLKAGDKRLISYAVDIGTRITTNIDSERDLIREVHFSRGILTTRSAQQQTKVYTVRNVDSKAKTLIIEHPLRPGYKLLNQKPSETTANAYRFEIKLAPGGEIKFPVTEEYVFERSAQIASLTPDVLVTYIQNRNLSDAARKALQSIADQKRQIAAIDSEIKRVNSESADLERDQNRIRQNISTLRSVSGQEQQVQQYSRQLSEGEARIVKLRDHSGELQRKRQAAETVLNDTIEKTVF